MTQNRTRSEKRSLATVPKAHLHAHLDGSFPLEAVQRLAELKGVDFEPPGEFRDVWHFFERYGTVPALVDTHEDLAGLCRALVHAEAALGVAYLEPAIEPQLYAPRLGSIQQVAATMVAALQEAAIDAGIEVGANLTVNTDCDEAIAWDLTTTAISLAGRGVTTLGTAGFVEPGNLTRFRDHAEAAHAAGLSVVSHAGQTGGPESVEEALNELRADRISHGFRSVESLDLLARLRDEAIMCDVCPVSNVRLGVVGSLESHPALDLLAAGVPVSLNADDALWFGATVLDQYELARSLWGLDDDQLAAIARHSSTAAGMSTGNRTKMQDAIAAWLAKEQA